MADIDELVGTFEQVVAAINRRDASAYSSFWHDQIVTFPPFSPFPVEGRATLPKTPERTQRELTLQILLGMPLTATKGYAAPEVEQVYARARELCRHGVKPHSSFPCC